MAVSFTFFSSFTKVFCDGCLRWGFQRLPQEERYSRLPLLSGLRELIEQLNLAAGAVSRDVDGPEPFWVLTGFDFWSPDFLGKT